MFIMLFIMMLSFIMMLFTMIHFLLSACGPGLQIWASSAVAAHQLVSQICIPDHTGVHFH